MYLFLNKYRFTQNVNGYIINDLYKNISNEKRMGEKSIYFNTINIFYNKTPKYF